MKLPKITKLGSIREILLLCVLLYFAQGALLPQGSPITQASLLLILGISFFYFFKVVLSKTKKGIFITAWSLLLIVNILGYLIALDFSNAIYVAQLKAILLFFLPFFPFYYLSKKGVIREEHLLRFFVLMLLISILNFNYFRDLIIASRVSGRADIVNNISYYFVLLLPYCFLFKKRVFAILSMFVILLFIIQGAKRGALIVGVLGAIFFSYHQFKTISRKQRIRGYIIVFAGIISLATYFYQYYLNNEYLITRMGQISDGGSGRDTIYLSLLQSWLNADSFFNLIFGYGFVSSIRLSSTGLLAHNDWLELLTSFGLFGVGLYLVIFYGLIKASYSKRFPVGYKITLLAIAAMWFLTTLFSMVYTSYPSVFMTMLIGFFLGVKDILKENYP